VFWRSFGAIVTAENHCPQGISGMLPEKKHSAKITFSPHIKKNSTFAPTIKPV
jgi:hypothetical protein